jgi:hypothetical protein
MDFLGNGYGFCILFSRKFTSFSVFYGTLKFMIDRNVDTVKACIDVPPLSRLNKSLITPKEIQA